MRRHDKASKAAAVLVASVAALLASSPLGSEADSAYPVVVSKDSWRESIPELDEASSKAYYRASEFVDSHKNEASGVFVAPSKNVVLLTTTDIAYKAAVEEFRDDPVEVRLDAGAASVTRSSDVGTLALDYSPSLRGKLIMWGAYPENTAVKFVFAEPPTDREIDTLASVAERERTAISVFVD